MSTSAVDAMLKDNGLVNGSLYDRINEAVTQGLFTKKMGEWVHRIRLLKMRSEPLSSRRHWETFCTPSQASCLRSLDEESKCRFLLVGRAVEVTRRPIYSGAWT